MERTFIIQPLMAKRPREVPGKLCDGGITTDLFFEISGASIAIPLKVDI